MSTLGERGPHPRGVVHEEAHPARDRRPEGKIYNAPLLVYRRPQRTRICENLVQDLQG
jgi:hypothetical protein